jgi:hypothetical protein
MYFYFLLTEAEYVSVPSYIYILDIILFSDRNIIFLLSYKVGIINNYV